MSPKVTIGIPFHWMRNWETFLTRCLKSIEQQSFTDYEVILMKAGSMPVGSNRVMQAAKGELVKILYMDDYFATSDSLQKIVDAFTPETNWLVTGCNHSEDSSEIKDPEMPTTHSPHYPTYTSQIIKGINTIGSPSVLTVRNGTNIFFDEQMSWLLDCDLYARFYESFGEPKILNDVNVTIGIGEHQTTHILTDAQKLAEHEYLSKKYSTYISA